MVSYARGCARRLEAGDLPKAALLEVLEEISAQALRAGEVLRPEGALMEDVGLGWASGILAGELAGPEQRLLGVAAALATRPRESGRCGGFGLGRL